MSSYQQLAGAYDELTWDVGYEKRADFLEKLFRRSRIPVHTVLDLACGTGSMTWLLAGRGYELIAVDGSEEMLAAAREKSAPAEVPPLFVRQTRGYEQTVKCFKNFPVNGLLLLVKMVK